MMDRRVEIKVDGMVVIQEVYGKPIVQQGFNWLRDGDIYEGKKKVGKRQIAIIIKGYERDADVGWIARKAGRAYVDRQGDRWQLR